MPQEGHDTLRSTAPEAIMSEEHITDLCTSESIDILRRVDTLGDRISIDMRGKWCLHDDAMDLLIVREGSYFFFESSLIDSTRESIESEMHPHLTSTLLLHADIGLTCRILSHEDDGEHRSITCWCEGDLISNRFEDGG